ncbi:MAG: alpha/beta hydrolase [Acidimicrobiales bacterium]
MVEPTPITFRSDDVALAGHLRLPEEGTPVPAVVFTGPFTGVKEQVTGTYAAALAERGYATLAFDHRNFGQSEGQPRQHEDSAGKARDLLDAVSFLATHPGVDSDRIGSVGICLGGSYALRHAAFDPRVRALTLVAGGFNSPVDMRAGMGPERYRQILAELATIAERTFATGEVPYIPAVSADQRDAAMPGDEPWAYYGTERAASPRWVNRVTRLSIRELLTLDAMSTAELVSPTPTLIVHGTTDAYCSVRPSVRGSASCATAAGALAPPPTPTRTPATSGSTASGSCAPGTTTTARATCTGGAPPTTWR